MRYTMIVRSVLKHAEDRPKFEHWYSTVHSPRVIELFGVEGGSRHWSCVDRTVHYAFYFWPNASKLEPSKLEKDGAVLSAEFEEAWPNVTRTRELIEQVESFGAV